MFQLQFSTLADMTQSMRTIDHTLLQRQLPISLFPTTSRNKFYATGRTGTNYDFYSSVTSSNGDLKYKHFKMRVRRKVRKTGKKSIPFCGCVATSRLLSHAYYANLKFTLY